MAQLRDAHTSELIATSSPTELALIAEAIGSSDVLFDDVGAAFNAEQVRKAYRDRCAELAEISRPLEQTERQAERNALRDAQKAREAMLTARARTTRRNRP